MSPGTRARRGRRRSAGRRTQGGVAQLPFRQPVHRPPPVEILSAEQVEEIHARSLAFLESDGVEVLSARGREVLRAAGAEVDEAAGRVRLDRGLTEALIQKAPPSFRLIARNPDRSLDVGGRAMVFTAVSSAPNAASLEGGRRPGCQRDFRDLLRLAQALNTVHALGGYPVEPTDLPPATRHLDCVADFVRLTDKTYRLYALGAERIRDGLEMTRIAHGLDEAALEAGCYAFTNVNVNSPLRLDGPMAEGLIEMSALNQAVIVTPFTLAGAMAPVSLA
ncbi:MAG: trimethylamine methyltransferase family protein, partial [Rhodovibrionaceae bacterium]|nr:trimethylamine methyltransferase family protein [Rhodovibrionaceae bacterium]